MSTVRLLAVSVATMAALTAGTGTATPTERPDHFRADARLDTSQVEAGVPLPECGSPADHTATACTVTAPDGSVIVADTDGTTFTIPTPTR